VDSGRHDTDIMNQPLSRAFRQYVLMQPCSKPEGYLPNSHRGKIGRDSVRRVSTLPGNDA